MGKYNNITIIILTYNRPSYLKRILDYYNKCEEGENDFKIIVADSSSDENKKLNRDVISSVSNLDIKYLDHYSPEINPHHKFADAVNYAQAKYCVFCADDDFVTPNGMRESVAFLEQNPDFAVAQGRYISFRLEDDKKGEQQFRWQFVYSPFSIESLDAESRLECQLSNYITPTFYGVHRTELQKMVYTEVLKSKTGPLFCELLLSMLDVVYGKLKCLDMLYTARDEDSIRLGYWLTLLDAIEAGIYDEEYAKFRDCLVTHLSKQSHLDTEESKRVVDKAMSAYLKKYYYPSKSNMGIGYITTRMGQTLDNLHLPGWLDRGIRKPYKELVAPRYIKKYSKDMSPSSTYYEDFNRVRRHVLSCSK